MYQKGKKLIVKTVKKYKCTIILKRDLRVLYNLWPFFVSPSYLSISSVVINGGRKD